MKNILFFIIILLYANSLVGQTVAGWESIDTIIVLRAELKAAITQNDRGLADEKAQRLIAFSKKQYGPLAWDERQLYYFWADAHRALLKESAAFSYDAYWAETRLERPPADGLFELLDNAVYDDKQTIKAALKADGNLTAEEKKFLQIHLEHVLRNNTTSEKEERYNFLKKHGDSRYADMVRELMSYAAPNAWSFGASFHQGNWSGNLERILKPAYGAQFSLAYWERRWNYEATLILSTNKLARDMPSAYPPWVKGESYDAAAFSIAAGYDLVNVRRRRIYPSIDVGLNWLTPPDSTEDASVGDRTGFFSAHIGASITAEAKFFFDNSPEADQHNKRSYYGPRFRVGYRRLRFTPDYADLKGNLFYFAVGISLFGK